MSYMRCSVTFMFVDYDSWIYTGQGRPIDAETAETQIVKFYYFTRKNTTKMCN